VRVPDGKLSCNADAEECLKRGSVHTARAMISHALEVFKAKKSVWRRAAQLEKLHGTRESLNAVLSEAVRHCPGVCQPAFSTIGIFTNHCAAAVTEECWGK
jgi:hypothetical protein